MKSIIKNQKTNFMDKDYINYQEYYPNLEKALKEGAVLKASLSGGSLRIVSVEKDGKELSYGEYLWLPGALAHAEDDFGLSYEQQYLATNSKHYHYYTGAYPLPHDTLDVYLKADREFEVFYSKSWKCFICITPAPRNLNRNNEVLWGSAANLLLSMSLCLTSFQLEDKEELMKRVNHG